MIAPRPCPSPRGHYWEDFPPDYWRDTDDEPPCAALYSENTPGLPCVLAARQASKWKISYRGIAVEVVDADVEEAVCVALEVVP
ncbi:MAG: hypothetical protein EBZ78_12465 [Verrucomicrobia bacterium]|nr:hypothetical protein [Verrucomicrobiota bacterium]